MTSVAEDRELLHIFDLSGTPQRQDWPEAPGGGVLVDVSSTRFPDAHMTTDRVFADRFCGDIKWCVDSSTGYVVAKIERRKVSFHRLLLQAPKGHLVDHINRDRTDNRIANLRFVSGAENAQNRKKARGATSRYIGVSWSPEKRLWRSGVRVSGSYWHLGYFENEIDAARAYDKAALMNYGKESQNNGLVTYEEAWADPRVTGGLR